MKKYQLTEDMVQDRKYWMTNILHKEMVKKCEKGENKCHYCVAVGRNFNYVIRQPESAYFHDHFL